KGGDGPGLVTTHPSPQGHDDRDDPKQKKSALLIVSCNPQLYLIHAHACRAMCASCGWLKRGPCFSQEGDRSPVAATVHSRAGVRQFGRRRRARDQALSPLDSPPMRTAAQAAPCATDAKS